jgi:predicted component of type VI protein secretion system
MIRIKSSQVSRRHCEIVETGDKLTLRDLGSANGTFVNGKRVIGQQLLKPGDEVTVGSITLRLAKLGQPAAAGAGSPAAPKAGDTAVVDAIAVEEEDEEFEMEFDDDTSEPVVEAIPLADEQPAQPADRKPPAKAAKGPPTPSAPTDAVPSVKPKAGKEDDAIAEFLLDLNLDDEE